MTSNRTVGKVFFRNAVNGKDYVCSASTVNSGSKQLVLTAGHCVHGGGSTGQWHLNWVFIPDYYYNSKPYGQYSAKYFRTFTEWINNRDLSKDVAFVTVWPNEFGPVVSVVGGNGLTVNQPFTMPLTIFGYPAEAPYDGGSQYYCQGNTTRPGTEYKISMQCDLSGGASGGPWLYQYNSTTQLGYANGTLSTFDPPSLNKSAYFDTAVYNMFVAAGDRT